MWRLILVISVVMAEKPCIRLLCRFFFNAMIRMLVRIREKRFVVPPATAVPFLGRFVGSQKEGLVWFSGSHICDSWRGQAGRPATAWCGKGLGVPGDGSGASPARGRRGATGVGILDASSM